MIGKSIPRLDAFEKVTGQTKYTADVYLEGMLYAKAVRSDIPHGRILKVDISEAKKLPGVIAVLTAEDVPGGKTYGKAIRDQPVLAFDKVRRIGDPVALVIAESLEVAEKAVSFVRIEYQPLPVISDPESAMKNDSVKVHETGNILYYFPIRKGDVENGFNNSDFVVENTYSTPRIEHACLELESAIAYYDENGLLTILAPSHNVYFDRREISHVLGLPANLVRVVQMPMGGTFGKREDIYCQVLVALAAFITKRPVKMIMSREESFITTTKRHPMRMHYKTGVNKDGKILALEVKIIADAGAYASWSPNIVRKAAIHATGPYEIPNVKIDAYAVYTNNPISGAMRGFGATQVAFAYESNMDAVASTIGIDPIEFRKKNLLRGGSFTATGQKIKEAEAIPKVTLETALQKFKNLPPVFSTAKKETHLKYGVGLATIFYGIGYGCGIPDIGSAIAELNGDGRITIYTSAIDYGQGALTIFAQIVSEIFNLSVESIRVITGDTLYTPDSGSTVASRQTYITGNAVKLAAEKLKHEIISFASRKWNIPPEDIILKEGEVLNKQDETKRLSFFEIGTHFIKQDGKPLRKQARFKAYSTPLEKLTGHGDAYPVYSFGTQIAEVEVNISTGEVKVLRVIAVHNVGKAINPVSVLGQIHGGIAMGMGMALYEEFKVENGIPITVNFKNYRIPKSIDIPEIIAVILEIPCQTGPFGAIGIGEPVTLATAPAIINAIYNAIGIRIYDLPATSEKIKELLKAYGF